MPVPNRISAAILPDDLTAIDAQFAAVNTKLPFLLELNDKDRDSLTYLKGPNKQFVFSTVDLVKTQSDFLPKNFNVEELQKDAKLYSDLHAIHQQRCTSLQNRIMFPHRV